MDTSAMDAPAMVAPASDTFSAARKRAAAAISLLDDDDDELTMPRQRAKQRREGRRAAVPIAPPATERLAPCARVATASGVMSADVLEIVELQQMGFVWVPPGAEAAVPNAKLLMPCAKPSASAACDAAVDTGDDVHADGATERRISSEALASLQVGAVCLACQRAAEELACTPADAHASEPDVLAVQKTEGSGLGQPPLASTPRELQILISAVACVPSAEASVDKYQCRKCSHTEATVGDVLSHARQRHPEWVDELGATACASCQAVRHVWRTIDRLSRTSPRALWRGFEPDAELRWRCAAGHEFLSPLRTLGKWRRCGRDCPACEVLHCGEEIASLHGTRLLSSHFCDGEVVRQMFLKMLPSTNLSQKDFTRPHAQPTMPEVPRATAWVTTVSKASKSQRAALSAAPGHVGVAAGGTAGGSSGEAPVTQRPAWALCVLRWACGAGHTWCTYERLRPVFQSDRWGKASGAGSQDRPPPPTGCRVTTQLSIHHLQPGRRREDATLRNCEACVLERQRSLFDTAKVAFSAQLPPACAPVGIPRSGLPRSGGRPQPNKPRQRRDLEATIEALAATEAAMEAAEAAVKKRRGAEVASDAEHADDEGQSVGSAEAECARVLQLPVSASARAVLGLAGGRAEASPEALVEQARKRFRQLAVRLHPDKWLGAEGQSEDAFKRVCQALRLIEREAERP